MPLIKVDSFEALLDHDGKEYCQCGKPADGLILHDDYGKPYFAVCKDCIDNDEKYQRMIGRNG